MATSVAPQRSPDGEGARDLLTPSLEVAGNVCALGFFIQGQPIHKARPRFAKNAYGQTRAYTPQETKDWERTVGWAARQQVLALSSSGQTVALPFSSRVICAMTFYMPKPKSYAKKVVWMTKKPDLDNLSKAVLDGLEKAGFIQNDGLVTDLVLSKRYAEVEGMPMGVRVELTGWL